MFNPTLGKFSMLSKKLNKFILKAELEVFLKAFKLA